MVHVTFRLLAFLVQGKTLLGRIDFSFRDCFANGKLFFLGARVVKPNWNYQTCNIFYRKMAVQLLGGFDERLNSGEDTDFGLRLIGNGFTGVFADDAVVYHSVIPVNFTSLIKYSSQAYYIPLLVKKHPYLRKRLFLSLFWTRRDFFFTLALLSAIGTIFSPLFSVFATIYLASVFLTYSAIHGFLKTKYSIIYRIVSVPFFIVKDLYNLAFFTFGSLKHRCFVL